MSEPNYHATKYFSETFLATEMRKTKAKLNKTVYLGLHILEVSETLQEKLLTGKDKKVIGLMKD